MLVWTVSCIRSTPRKLKDRCSCRHAARTTSQRSEVPEGSSLDTAAMDKSRGLTAGPSGTSHRLSNAKRAQRTKKPAREADIAGQTRLVFIMAMPEIMAGRFKATPADRQSSHGWPHHPVKADEFGLSVSTSTLCWPSFVVSLVATTVPDRLGTHSDSTNSQSCGLDSPIPPQSPYSPTWGDQGPNPPSES